MFFKSEHDNCLFNAILRISEYNTKEMKVKAVVKVFQYIFYERFWIKLSVNEFTRLTVNELYCKQDNEFIYLQLVDYM